MFKRPHRGETEEDLLRMQQQFLEERKKNPHLQPAAKIVKPEKITGKKSLFALKREAEQNRFNSVEPSQKKVAVSSDLEATTDVLSDIVEKSKESADILPNDTEESENHEQLIPNAVMGDIVEKSFSVPKDIANTLPMEAFPEVDASPIKFKGMKGKSLFTLSMEAKKKNVALEKTDESQTAHVMDVSSSVGRDLNTFYGTTSVIVDDINTGAVVHNENLRLLVQMSEENILEERRKLLDTIDPSLVALLAKRRKEKSNAQVDINETSEPKSVDLSHEVPMELESSLDELPISNPAVELLERGTAENWVHFNVVEKDKLAWMQDIPQQIAQLEPGEQFEARFDWKGILMPHSTTTSSSETYVNRTSSIDVEKDERELYLHGEEPNRPGYTLQELFRLARSNIMQQRFSAFGAIAGLLNIYNQGFYDRVLELPVSKIFFLLRFGLDDNTPALLEIVTKALAYLFYNETDEMLLDLMFENPALHWQPTLQTVAKVAADEDDPTSIENLQKQMKQMQMSSGVGGTIKANVQETEEESKMSMSDFQLAETDLVDCFLRTDILQRIYYILYYIKPDNSTVTSCLKILIRLARTNKEVAMQIVNNKELMDCLLTNFLPGFEVVDTTLQDFPFYRCPQHLCLKLVRILIAQNLGIAIKFINHNIVDKLQNYLFNRNDIKGKLIRVQIEALRVLRCLLMLRIDATLYRKFLPAFRYMLEWHYNHVIYKVGGPVLIRQHAAALLAAISAGPGGMEASSLLGGTLYDCCSNWFHKATRMGVKEFSQATLLSGCINAVAWYTRHCDKERFHGFVTKYLRNFVQSTSFDEFVASLPTSSIMLREAADRRLMHAALPNVGAVLMHQYGPQLILPQIYAIPLLTSLWRLIELGRDIEQKIVVECLIQPRIVEPLANFLSRLGEDGRINQILATNFYAKAEVQLICKLLCFEAFETYFNKPQMLQIVYNVLSFLTAEHIIEIEELFERVIFNTKYLCGVDPETLNKWRNTCLELVHAHSIVVQPTELTLSLPFMQTPILPRDWPYFQLRDILQSYIENVQHTQINKTFSEKEVLRMTFTFVEQLERGNPNIQIATPTEKLMYLMIAFMGPESHFLDSDMQILLRQHILNFYAQCKDHTFQFEEFYEGKCQFENLYALFVDHFQAASYGNELFGSLVLVPLAQKYNNKWRRRVWSEYAASLRWLDCSENLLLGGLHAYLEPAETDESLVRAYAGALNSNLIRQNTIPYKIAKHHVTQFRMNLNK